MAASSKLVTERGVSLGSVATVWIITSLHLPNCERS
jgi:hypothetical protein